MKEKQLVLKKNKVASLIKKDEGKGQGIYVRIPTPLLTWVDKVQKKYNFNNRSQALRAIIESVHNTGFAD